MESILTIIAFIGVFFLILYIIQFFSAVSNKRIVSKGGNTIASPNDFHETNKMLKSGVQKGKKLILQGSDILLIKSKGYYVYFFEKINHLTKNPTENTRFSSLIELKKKIDAGHHTIIMDGVEIFNSSIGRSIDISKYNALVKHVEGLNIGNFHKILIEFNIITKEENYLEFLDHIGLENIREIYNILISIHDNYWRNNLTEEELNKLKKLVIMQLRY